MGERKCGYEGCNALEFRTTGHCLRHKDGKHEEKNQDENSVESNPEPKAAESNPKPRKIDDRPTSLGFKRGFFYTPLSLH